MNFTEISNDNYLNIWYNYILKPVIDYEYKELYSYVDYNEDEIFKTIYPHDAAQMNFHLCRLPQILPFSVYIVPLFIQILCGFSLGWFLYITCKHICGKRKKSLGKVDSFCFLRLKFVLSFLTLILLCLTAIATYKISFLLDWSFRNAIKTTSDVVNNVRNEKTKFESQLSNINRSVIDTILSIENAMTKLPGNIYDETYEIVKNELIENTASYNEIMMKTNFIFEQSGMKKLHDGVEQILEKELNITEKLMSMFNQNIERIISNVTKDVFIENGTKEIILHDLYSIKNYSSNLKGNYKFTNWSRIYTILDETYNKILPELNNSTQFLHYYWSNIRNYIKPNINEVKDVMEKFRDKTEFIIKKLRHIIQQIFHSNAAKNFKKIVEYTNNTEISLNRNTTLGFDSMYLSTFLFLIPFLHTLFYLIFMIQCVNWAAYQVYYNFKKKRVTSDIPCFKVMSEIGLMLLWAGLSLSVLCYLGALALSTICRPLHTQRLYTQYIDNQREWNNKTWLDAVVYPWNHNYELKNVLEKCSNNVTFYRAFDVDEYWNVSAEFRNYEINTDNEKWIKLIKTAVKDVKLPTDQSCMEAKNNFNVIEKALAHISSHIMDDVELFENKSFKNLLENVTTKYSKSHFYDELGQNLDILNFIQNQDLGYLLSNFMEFKYLLKSNQNHLTKIKQSQDQMIDKIKLNIESVIKNGVEGMENYVNGIMNNMEQNLLYNIEHNYGNCHYYSDAIRITQSAICGNLPLILNMAWMVLTFNAILMLISIALSRNLATDVMKLRQEYRKTLKREAQERMLKHRQQLMDGTLLFDRRGQVLGSSRTLLNGQQQ